jgi:hypothetical protein
MNRILAVLVGITVVAGSATTTALAQRGMNWGGSGGWGPGNAYGRMYDPKTVETLQGEVVSVDVFAPGNGMSSGVHLTLKTPRETVSVHLGPEWYISAQDTKIEPKDSIEIQGSRVTFDGKPAIIAARLRKGPEEIILRDESGFPAWAGWRRRS